MTSASVFAFVQGCGGFARVHAARKGIDLRHGVNQDHGEYGDGQAKQERPTEIPNYAAKPEKELDQ